MSDQKQFSYKCRCSFLEVSLNLNVIIKLPNVAESLPLGVANAFFCSFFSLFCNRYITIKLGIYSIQTSRTLR